MQPSPSFQEFQMVLDLFSFFLFLWTFDNAPISLWLQDPRRGPSSRRKLGKDKFLMLYFCSTTEWPKVSTLLLLVHTTLCGSTSRV